MRFRNGILAAVAATVLVFSQGADAKTFKWAFHPSKPLISLTCIPHSSHLAAVYV